MTWLWFGIGTVKEWTTNLYNVPQILNESTNFDFAALNESQSKRKFVALSFFFKQLITLLIRLQGKWGPGTVHNFIANINRTQWSLHRLEKILEVPDVLRAHVPLKVLAVPLLDHVQQLDHPVEVVGGVVHQGGVGHVGRLGGAVGSGENRANVNVIAEAFYSFLVLLNCENGYSSGTRSKQKLDYQLFLVEYKKRYFASQLLMSVFP